MTQHNTAGNQSSTSGQQRAGGHNDTQNFKNKAGGTDSSTSSSGGMSSGSGSSSGGMSKAGGQGSDSSR